MGLRVIIDTNIFISVINNEKTKDICKEILILIEKNQIEGAISTIILSEVLKGYYMNGETINATKFIQSMKKSFNIVDVNADIATQGAKIGALNRIKLPDALINASLDEIKADYVITQDINFEKKGGEKVIFPQKFLEIFKKKK